MPGPTLIRPPPADRSKSPMENVLELTRLSVIGPDLYTNTRELWHPPKARGVYGGAVTAQCLSAATDTLPLPSAANNNAVFLPHSMHCYFVLAGDSTIPILYHVERVREGKSFITRTVQARQRGKCIFTTTISFMRESSVGEKAVEHAWDMPEGVEEGLERILQEENTGDEGAAENGVESEGPFISKRLGIYNQSSSQPHNRKPQSWLKCRGTISASGGLSAHLSALAYMSDSWFIGTVVRVHSISRFSNDDRPRPPSDPTPDASANTTASATNSTSEATAFLRRVAEMEAKELALEEKQARPQVGMIVSLDHVIYFHAPREVRADEWLCSEMESPWSGQGRGLVMQRMWNRRGTLVASCVQEGLVRLIQDDSGQDDSGQDDSGQITSKL